MILNNKGDCCTELFSVCCNDKNKMTFERAPEPSDVYWENLNITTCQRFLRVACTYFGTVLVIGICFGIIYGINIAKIELKKVEGMPEWIQTVLSYVCSFVIIGVN